MKFGGAAQGGTSSCYRVVACEPSRRSSIVLMALPSRHWTANTSAVRTTAGPVGLVTGAVAAGSTLA